MAKPPPRADSKVWTAFNKLAAFNRVIYRASGGRLGNKLPGTDAPVILVHTTGAKSGKKRVQPLIGLDDEGRWVIVASKGGTDKHPAWYHNLRANPETEIEVGRKRIPVKARVVEESERAELWPKLVEIYPPYEEYQEFAGERRIPVLSLDPR
jgi:F420H(2)-dependent quinone reductase